MAHDGRRLRAVLIGLTIAVPAAAIALPQFGLFGNPGCGLPMTTCTRVLFIGDSYTYVNDLPATFADLAWSAGYRVDAETLAVGGGTLAGHVADPATATTISSQAWNTVVLQDQSENPASPTSRQSEMFPAATQLTSMIRGDGAEPMFFLTWGHQSGWPEDGIPTYLDMQAAVDQGYLEIAAKLSVPIAPVGAAWQSANAEQANAQLWQGDGVHPTVTGTYLAACVFFAAIFHRTPAGLTYRDGLSAAEASALQQVAAVTTLAGGIRWGLP
jgi:hypothetical protein